MKKVFLSLLLSFIVSSLLAQSKVEVTLQTINEKYPQEKIHLFVNKEAFVAGETIWLKAYILTGNVQSLISKTLYVELINEEKQSIKQVLVPLINAVGEASITLSRTLPEGNYYLRAYTKWMLNFDESYQYMLHLPIYNPSSPRRLVPKPIDWTASIYPESGSLLAEQVNKIAVRLTAKGRLPENWDGYLVEEGNPEKKLLSFSSINPQFATFTFTPDTDKTYILFAYDSLENISTVKFKPSFIGVGLRAKQQGDILNVKMLFQGLPNGGTNHKLVIASHGQVIYSALIKKADSVISTSLPINKLMTGIVQLTLFDSNEKAVAERLVFLQTETQAKVNVTTPTNAHQSNELNEWLIEADTTLPLSYAISITDASSTPARTRSIKSDLWLGDFTSPIHNPNWYFNTDTIRLEALDALMISEKWSRYQWEDILSDRFPTINYLPENYLLYKGTATRNGKKIKEEKLGLIFKFKDSPLQFSEVKTDENGAFFIRDAAFNDSVQVFYHPSSVNGAIKNIVLTFERENQFTPYQGPLPESNLQLSDSMAIDTPAFVKSTLKLLRMQDSVADNVKTLQEIKVTARLKSLKEQLNEKISSPLFNTGNQEIIDFINEEQHVLAYNNIFDWLESRVAGLGFVKLDRDRADPQSGAIIPAGERIPIMRGEIPAIFLDEVVGDISLIHSLPISEIAMVKIIKGYFMGANGGGSNGAIAIYTKRAGIKANEKTVQSPAGILVGYPSFESFKAVNDVDTLNKALKSISRQQLYWNTRLFTTRDSKANVQFYNNDFPSPARLVIEGFTVNGQPIYFEKVMN